MGQGIKSFCVNTLAYFRGFGEEVLLDNVELDNADNVVLVSEVRQHSKWTRTLKGNIAFISSKRLCRTVEVRC